MDEKSNENKSQVSSTEISEILNFIKKEILNKKRKQEIEESNNGIDNDNSNAEIQQETNKNKKLKTSSQQIQDRKTNECEFKQRASKLSEVSKKTPSKLKPKPELKKPTQDSIPKSTQKEVKVLNPRPVLPFAPASHQQRVKFLVLLSNQIKKIDPGFKFPNINSILMEYQIANESTKNNYVSNFKSFFIKIKKSNSKELPKLLNLDNELKSSSSVNGIDHLSNDTILKFAKQLIHSDTVLSSNGYVIEFPKCESAPIIIQSNQVKICERCKQKFKPNIDDGFKGTCQYHPGKKVFYNMNNNQKYFKTQCCDVILPNNNNEADPGLVMGCKINNFHVFKDSNHEELQRKIGFTFSEKRVTGQTTQKSLVGLDAEMVYTTKGFEVARVTVVDFYNSEEILYDKLVMPFGKVIDYNSDFSGIHNLSKDNTVSFYQMRQELNDIIDSDTIIIGHGLENDFNVLRLIHKNVLDTAILFPTKNKRGKYPLKTLADTYLNSKIQTGEHSSAEDSIAAIELVKYKIKKMAENK